jgi:hypothetical protein
MGNIPAAKLYKDVPFERFDIDEMPGQGRIKIR